MEAALGNFLWETTLSATVGGLYTGRCPNPVSILRVREGWDTHRDEDKNYPMDIQTAHSQNVENSDSHPGNYREEQSSKYHPRE